MADQASDGNGAENTDNQPKHEPSTPENPPAEGDQAAAPAKKKTDKGMLVKTLS